MVDFTLRTVPNIQVQFSTLSRTRTHSHSHSHSHTHTHTHTDTHSHTDLVEIIELYSGYSSSDARGDGFAGIADKVGN